MVVPLIFAIVFALVAFGLALLLRHRFPRNLLGVGGLLVLFCLFLLVAPPGGGFGGIKSFAGSAMLRQARQIDIMMFQYSIDHDGAYPTGRSSTEAFQKLIDEAYCIDPSVFYFPLAGKTKPSHGQPLRPENVCWDITTPLSANSPDQIPVTYPTGYKIGFTAGGSAVPVAQAPVYRQPDYRTWWQTLLGWAAPEPLNGIGLCYKSNAAVFIKAVTGGRTQIIPGIIPVEFHADGVRYRQLTPTGILPP